MIEETQLGPTIESTIIGEEGPVSSSYIEPIDYTIEEAPYDISKPELIRREDIVDEVVDIKDSSITDYANVMNGFFGVKTNTGLNHYNPDSWTWEPESSEWFNSLSPDDRVAVAGAKSEEYAHEIMDRRGLYNESAKKIAQDSLPVQLGMGLVGSIDPTWALPVGYVSASLKVGYNLATKATKLSVLAGESAILSMGSASLNLAMNQAGGVETDVGYGYTNLYAGLLGGSLPMLGTILGGGYNTAKIAKGLTTDPKNFLALSGELTAEAVGGTQARTIYNKLTPQWMKSDVMITAEADNPYITLISNRLDSPSIAVISRDTGKPVPIGTTGQDYKGKFNGRQRMTIGDIKGYWQQSSIKSEEEFFIEVGKTMRERANKQDIATYTELNDHIEFTQSEAKIAQKEELDAFINQESPYYKNDKGRDVFLTEEEVIRIEAGEAFPHKIYFKKTHIEKDVKAFEAELKVRVRDEISGAIDAKKAEIYAKNQLEFEHGDPMVVKAAQRGDEYYKSVLEEGHRLDVVELKHINTDRHYLTRIFDFQKIREMDHHALTIKIRNALEAHPANKGIKDLNKAASDIVTKLKNLDYSKEFADYSFMVPKELGADAYFRSRNFKLDERAIQDILVNDISDVMGQYSYAQVGHYAAMHSFPELQGIPRSEQLDLFRETFIEPLRKKGTPTKAEGAQLDALERMFSDLLGTFRIAADSNSFVWKGTRMMNNVNSMTFGGGFALNTAAEMGGLLLDGHVANIMKARLGSLKEIGTMFSGKTIEDPLVRDFVLMGQFENLFETNSMQKLSDTEAVFNVGKIENSLNKGTSEFFKYTGLRGATVALEAMVGPKVIHDIMDFGKLSKLGLADEKYLARIGLSHIDTKIISKALNKVGEFTKSGKIYNMNLDKMPGDVIDKITTAVSRGMRQTVIKGDSTYLPFWMIKPNSFNRLALQFLRYPMAATETLMARGMDESMAKWTAATLTSTFMMSLVLYGREQAAMAAGLKEESEAKYDKFWEDDKAAMRLFSSALAKAGTLGPVDVLMGKASAITGVPVPGHEYAERDVLSGLMGPTFSRLPALRDIFEPLIMRGEVFNAKSWYAFKSMMPGATIPFINEYLTTQIKENTY